MATQFKQGGASALPIDTVTATCRAIHRTLGVSFTGIRSKPFHSATFSGASMEFDVDGDLPDGLDVIDFAPRGAIIADIVAIGPRTLSILAVEAW